MSKSPKILLANGRAICTSCHYNEEINYEEEVRFQKCGYGRNVFYRVWYDDPVTGRLEFYTYPPAEFRRYFRLVKLNEFDCNGDPYDNTRR